MSVDQFSLFAILGVTVAMFLWGRWRHDMVAIAALLLCVLLGLVPADTAFAGFGHPAVITVACVLILSGGLQASGAVDLAVRRILPASSNMIVTVASLAGVAAVLSAFMNNVGALALLMPVAVQIAARQGIPPGRLLMPLAFGSILGGMTTLIGTPPNLIVASFSNESGADRFGMFDFTPVGLTVAAAGVAFLILVGWRLVPARKRAGIESFDTAAYLTEARIVENSKAAGITFKETEDILEESGAQLIGLVRGEIRLAAPRRMQKTREGDILVIEAEPERLASALSSLGLKLEENVSVTQEEKAKKRESGKAENASEEQSNSGEEEKNTAPSSNEIVLAELAIMPNSPLIGRSASDINLRRNYNINLLAVSRHGRRSMARLRTMKLQAGDVLLMHGVPERIALFTSHYSCAPLAERPLSIPDKRGAFISVAIMAGAVATAATGVVAAAVSFAGGVLAALMLKVVSPRRIYGMVDWPVIVMLAALIPVAGAMATTGAAGIVATGLIETVARGDAVMSMALILIVTMTLSDFMNNAATATVMCPISLSVAEQLGVSASPFLMAVAIGASCAFLTPIGHQNNTLILGPGGFRFGDYWKLGLPMEIIVVVVSIPMLLLVWPL